MTHASGGVVGGEGWQTGGALIARKDCVEFLLESRGEFSGKICRADALFDGEAELVQLS